MLRKISPCFTDFCIVAATGPSLTPDVAQACRGFDVVAVNDAHQLLPFARVLYACDNRWWLHHEGAPDFAGEKWSSHGCQNENNKIETAKKYGLNLIKGLVGEGFSADPSRIHYGSNSGFQAVNLAMHFMGHRGRIALVGFDMRAPDGKRHFFGDHPAPLHRAKDASELNRYFKGFTKEFDRAAKLLRPGIEIVNCTPGSALECFPKARLEDVLPVAA